MNHKEYAVYLQDKFYNSIYTPLIPKEVLYNIVLKCLLVALDELMDELSFDYPDDSKNMQFWYGVKAELLKKQMSKNQ